VILCVGLVAVGTAAAASSARQSKQQAEVNLLHTPRLVGRWQRHLVDPKTSLVRSNTVVRCTGVGRGVHGSFHRFRCTLHDRSWRLTVSYLALPKGHFRARKLRATRVSG
jgi:hypothetical protein